MLMGEVIRKYRKEAGITQEEMAKRLGVTTPAVNKWENSNTMPDVALLAPIARLLNITTDTLLSFREELTLEEIGSYILQMNQDLEKKAFDEVFSFARKIIEEYPNCFAFIWQAAVILEARLVVFDVPDSVSYQSIIQSWYERCLTCGDEKIRNQAALMERLNAKGARRLLSLAEEVKNGDPSNCEAQAARIYFQSLGPDGFVRDREGAWPNAPLNYGYAILRAATARALVGSGLVCFHGIHHHNRYNAFALADDIMEPYRPFVDQYVLGKVKPFDVPMNELTKEMRSRLLQMLTCDVNLGEMRRPLMVALSFTTSSLAKYYMKKTDELALPGFS